MKVKRIVANVKAKNVGDAKRFYEKVLGPEQLMNLGWIATYGSNAKLIVHQSFSITLRTIPAEKTVAFGNVNSPRPSYASLGPSFKCMSLNP